MIASYGGQEWADLAQTRALPSAERQNAHQVVVVHQPDGDVATSRNAGAAEATGDWLCFLDADDELAPNYLAAIERTHRAYIQRRPGIRYLFTPAVSHVTNGRRGPARLYRPVNLASGNWLVIGTVVHHQVFDEVGGFRPWPHGLEDWDVWARIWRTGVEIVKVPRAVYVAYRNDRSKHHLLAQNKAAYMQAYNQVAASHAQETP